MNKKLIFTALLCIALAVALFAMVAGYLHNDHAADHAVVDAIMSRRSIRAYAEQPVEREKMATILKCGIAAPNAMNRQEWELRVVDNADWIERCTAAYVAGIKDTPMAARVLTPDFRNMFRNAPTVVFIAALPSKYAGVNCGLLGENMILAAHSMGIGSCCLGSPVSFLNDEAGKEFLASLGFSEGYELLYAIGFGYGTEQPEARPRDESKIKYVD